MVPSKAETKASRRLFSPSVRLADSALSFWRKLQDVTNQIATNDKLSKM